MKLRNEISAKMIIATPAMSSRASRDRKKSPAWRCPLLFVVVLRVVLRLVETAPAPADVALPPGRGGDVGLCCGGGPPVRVVGPLPGREGELPPDDPLPIPPGKPVLEVELLPGRPGREVGLLVGDGEPGREPGRPPEPGREGEPGSPLLLLLRELEPTPPGRPLDDGGEPGRDDGVGLPGLLEDASSSLLPPPPRPGRRDVMPPSSPPLLPLPLPLPPPPPRLGRRDRMPPSTPPPLSSLSPSCRLANGFSRERLDSCSSSLSLRPEDPMPPGKSLRCSGCSLRNAIA
ncbi:MAG: hypothetical protein WBH90_09720 [Aggregatilineales bacterium]